MKSSPMAQVLGLRYLPFLLALVLIAGLVVLAPSRPAGAVAGPGLGGVGTSDGSSGPAGLGASAGPGGDATGGSGTTGNSGLQATGGQPGTQAGTTGRGQAGGPAAVTSCPGFQPGPYYTGIPCVSGFTGSNGGATMRGVSGDTIRFTWWQPQSNAATSAVLAQAGFGQSPDQLCQGMQAFYNSIVKRFQFYGRKLVSVDGPGNSAGSAASNSCHFPYYASQCNTSPPDFPCMRAEADTIASMGIAFVLAPAGYEPLYQELARYGVTSIGDTPTLATSRALRNQVAPYWWGANGSTNERILSLSSEYFCNRLAGRPPEYAGTDVTATATKRHVGLVYYSYPGDDTTSAPAKSFVDAANRCGDSNVKSYQYSPDVTQSQAEATNITAQLQADHVTTVACFCDVITILFFLKAADNNNYHPEQLMVGVGTAAADSNAQVGNAASPDQLKHVFGLSNFAVNLPDSTADYHKAYTDGGGPGGESALDAVDWPSWLLMAQLIQQAGPQLAPSNIYRGGEAIPGRSPSPTQVGMKYGAPDYFTPLRDVAEVWFNPSLRSESNGSQGAYCYVNGARRYDLGQIPTGEPNLFSKSGPCATTRG